jgi:hypothetical protein
MLYIYWPIWVSFIVGRTLPNRRTWINLKTFIFVADTTDCRILSFGWFPGVWILCADVSVHCSIFMGDVRCLHHLWRLNMVSERRHIKFRGWGITQKKEYNIQNTAKVWKQEQVIVFHHKMWLHVWTNYLGILRPFLHLKPRLEIANFGFMCTNGLKMTIELVETCSHILWCNTVSCVDYVSIFWLVQSVQLKSGPSTKPWIFHVKCYL